jgi:hypothetical protein
MTNISRAAITVLMCCAAFPGLCWAQRGIPLRPPPRAVFPRFRPIVPVPLPHEPDHGGTQSNLSPTKNPGVDLLVGVVSIAYVVLLLGFVAWRRRAVAHPCIVRTPPGEATVVHLCIVRTPPGEAPESIRQAWVGVELPLRRGETEPGLYQTVGVLSHVHPEMAMGYAVDGHRAVRALASHSLQAAAWWRQHAPHVLEPGYRFWFPCEVCQRSGPALGHGEQVSGDYLEGRDSQKI